MFIVCSLLVVAVSCLGFYLKTPPEPVKALELEIPELESANPNVATWVTFAPPGENGKVDEGGWKPLTNPFPAGEYVIWVRPLFPRGKVTITEGISMGTVLTVGDEGLVLPPSPYEGGKVYHFRFRGLTGYRMEFTATCQGTAPSEAVSHKWLIDVKDGVKRPVTSLTPGTHDLIVSTGEDGTLFSVFISPDGVMRTVTLDAGHPIKAQGTSMYPITFDVGTYIFIFKGASVKTLTVPCNGP